jgi:hypothetical protein
MRKRTHEDLESRAGRTERVSGAGPDRGSREMYWPMEEDPAKTQHDTPEKRSGRAGRGDRESRTVWGHSLPAAAVCIGGGAAIALVVIFGQPG